MELEKPYIEELRERSKKSHAHTKHQLLGLEIAGLLEDQEHKALYIKLAKEGNAAALRRLAQEIKERKGIKNKGAYFMKLWKIERNALSDTKHKQ